MALLLLFAAIIIVFGSIAWFTMSRELESSGLQMAAEGQRYLIKTVDSNNQGVYFNDYHSLVMESDAAVWLVDSTSNLANATDVGIEPGSSGTMTFYVVPLDDVVSLDFTFRFCGYASSTTNNTVSMRALNQSLGDPAYYLSGHLLLFKGDMNGLYYTDLIENDVNGARSFSRTFRKSDLATAGVDTNNDNVNDAFQVDVHWVWPHTLSTMIDTGDPTIQLLCDPTVQAQGDETTDYQQLKTYMLSHPSYFLAGYDASSVLNETAVINDYADYGSAYDRADQDIGSSVHFVLLQMEANDSITP